MILSAFWPFIAWMESTTFLRNETNWPRTGACVGACAGALVAESAVRAGESMSRRAVTVKKNNGGKVSLTAKIGGLTF